MRRKYIAMALIISALTTVLSSNEALASTSSATVIPYVQDNGVDAANIVDLAKAMHVEVKKVDGGIEMSLNNKRVIIYDNDSTIYINGSGVPYKTTKMKDSETGKTYDMPIAQKPTKSGDGYLISKTIIQDKIGIDCDSDGIHVNGSETKDAVKQITQNDNASGTVVEKDIKVTNPTENTTVGSSIKGLMYEIDSSGQSVDVALLADAIGEKVKTIDDGIEVYLNGRKVSIVASTGCTYIDGVLVYDKATKIKDKYLIPKDVVQDKLGIFCDWDAFKIKREVDSKGNVKVTSISDHPSTSINSDNYQPVYDYDLKDFVDNYIDSHNISRITYDSSWTPDIERQMYAERAANINEGWHTQNGKFYFLKNGVPVKGWYKDVVTWYYFNSDGSMKTGWFKEGGEWYYFYDSGAMARNVCVNGYYLNDYGAMTNEVPQNAPTGISYQELINRIRSIGYSHKMRFDESSKLDFKIDCPDYEFFWYKSKYVDFLSSVSIKDNNICHISSSFTDDDPDFTHDYNILLGWLFPTQKNEIFNKVNKAGAVKQTIYADGRVVEVSFHQGGIDLEIKDQ